MSAYDVLKKSGDDYKIVDYKPVGSDERQFCSPGFNLPVGSLVRTYPFHFTEYHTSADNTEFVKAEYLADSFSKYFKLINDFNFIYEEDPFSIIINFLYVLNSIGYK